jgi:S1-C subfamily serine protease
LGSGLLSGLRTVEDKMEYIQISAPISSGSSGGGLFDERGNLIGVTTFTIRDAQNLNFALAASQFFK